MDANEAVPNRVNSEETPARKLLYSFEEYMELGGEPIEYLIDELLPKGSFTLVSGPPKVGKSFLTILMAISLATGREFMGRKVAAPQKVLFVEEEDVAQLVVQRLKQLCKGLNLTKEEKATLKDNLFFWPRNGLLISVKTDGLLVCELNDDIKKINADVVIVDVLALIHDGDENNVRDMTVVLKTLVAYQDANEGLTMVILHHTNKQASAKGTMTSIRGSSAISGRTDNALFLNKEKKGLSLSQVTKYDQAVEDVVYDMVYDKENEVVRFVTSDDFVAEKSQLEKIASKLRETAPAEFATEDIEKVLSLLKQGKSAASVSRVTKKLLEAGLIEVVSKGEKGKQFFRLV